MKRVLFVDDEPKVLDALRRLLYAMRRQWEMAFLAGGQEALAYLAQHPCDVVVTDMRMPGIDGSQLLRQVRQLTRPR
jgi:CheY-like chemotaxis protein